MTEPQPPETKKDLSVSASQATLLSFGFGIPPACILIGLYFIRWRVALNIDSNRPELFFYFFIGFVAALVLGSVIHELIHALTWVVFGHMTLKSVKFGFQWKTFTPYAHCPEAMEVGAYLLGVSMPLVLLGIMPSLIGISIGNGWLMSFGFLFTLAAGGDLVVLWLIRGVKRGQLVQDHPTQVGCYLIESPYG